MPAQVHTPWQGFFGYLDINPAISNALYVCDNIYNSVSDFLAFDSAAQGDN